MKGNRWRRCFLAFNYLSLAALWTTAYAAEKSPFYQDKTLNIVINFAAGGPTDIESSASLPSISPGIFQDNPRSRFKPWAAAVVSRR